MSNFILQKTSIENLKIIVHQPSKDERGSLSRLFCKDKLSQLIDKKTIQQVNKSYTKKKEQFADYIISTHHLQKSKSFLA